MLSVDTNVVVRLLTADDPKQFRAAEALFAAGPVWISKTVILETEWVLRDSYRLKRPEFSARWSSYWRSKIPMSRTVLMCWPRCLWPGVGSISQTRFT